MTPNSQRQPRMPGGEETGTDATLREQNAGPVDQGSFHDQDRPLHAREADLRSELAGLEQRIIEINEAEHQGGLSEQARHERDGLVAEMYNILVDIENLDPPEGTVHGA